MREKGTFRGRDRLAGVFDRHRFWGIAVLLGLAGLFAPGLFGPLLLGSERLAFRDVGHFYLPLYGQLGARWAGDGLPLWNPWDRFGIPVAGETTTAIFYPPRWLFACGVPADYAMTLYVLGHLLIAGSGAYWAARWAQRRHWLRGRHGLGGRDRSPPRHPVLSGAGWGGRCGTRADRLAALAAAFVYPAAGPVFFLYTNPPFLVGAAWLPWALGGLLRTLYHPSLGTTSIASIALAMAILGGDPQTALHAVLFSGIYWATLHARAFWKRTSLRVWPAMPAPSAAAPQGLATELQPKLYPLLVCAVLAGGLASLQILPGAAWSLQSWRRASPPPNVYSYLASAFASPAAPETAPAARLRAVGSRHGADVYDYSVAPWHWAELASPFVSGRLFPIHGRLTQLIPGEPRIWTLTLYAGLLPLVCLLAGPLHPRRWTVWQGLIVTGLVLSLGDFGAARLVRSVLEPIGLRLPSGVPDAAGGGYWWLVTLVPGYGQFRYPAKWLPLAAFGLAVWTAVFLSHSNRCSRHRSGRIARGLGLVAVLVLALTWLPQVRAFLTARASAGDFSDSYWGPLDISAGLHSLRWSLALTALVAACYGTLFKSQAKGIPWSWLPALGVFQPLARRRVIALSLLVLLVDLGFSASWQLATVPRGRLAASAAPAAEAIPERYLSLLTAQDFPPHWRRTHSADRLQEVEAAQRELWVMRWHLADFAAVTNSAVSIASLRSTLFWAEARQYAFALPPARRRVFVESLHQYLGITATVDSPPPTQPHAASPLRLHLSPVADPLPLIRWHSAWRSSTNARASNSDFAPASDLDLIAGQLHELFDEVLAREGAVVPRIESSHPGFAPSPAVEPNSPDPPSGAADPSRVTLVSWQPERVRVRVEAATAGLVTVQQLQDGFWRARIRRLDDAAPDGSPSDENSPSPGSWRSERVHRVDVIAQGVLVPPGRYELEFYYRPSWFLPATTLTVLTILALAICGIRSSISGRSRKENSPPAQSPQKGGASV